MKRLTSVLSLAAVAVCVLFAAACPERTSIADIEANPSKFENKQVAIAGTVKDSYGVSVPGTPIRGGAYKIDDGTGAIWVVTEDSVPVKGAKIGVKGRVGTGVQWSGKNYGLGMYEEGRKVVKR